MNKIWAIARKDLYLRFTDRNLLLLLIAAPLAISTIVGLVFSGFGSDGGLSISNIPVAVVNQDEGAEQQGQQVNYGDMLVSFLVPGETASPTADDVICTLADEPEAGFGGSIGELIAAEQVNDVAAARAGVESGDYAAMILVPPDFSRGLMPEFDGSPDSNGATTIDVYANSGESIAGVIVRSVVEGFTNRIMTGNIAITASINTLIEQNPAAALQLATRADSPEVGGVFACGFSGGALNTIDLDPQPVNGSEQRSVATQILVQTGSGQAVLFALFAAQFGVLSIIEERRAGTLQRIMTTATPRRTIITGKLVGTLATAAFQLILLMLALTLVASIIEGGLTLIWGSNIIALALVVLSLSLSVSGLGVLLTGIARTPEQVGPIGAVINIIMAVLGGAFGFAVGAPLAYLSMIYWGTDAFQKLSAGSGDIALNVAVLLAQGGIMFAVGLFLFNRRVEV